MQQIVIVNRSEENGRELAQLLVTEVGIGARFVKWEGVYRIPAGTDILINATSLGMDDANVQLPLLWNQVKPGMAVADVIFYPPDTLFLKQSRAAGCTSSDGLGMLVNQGVIGFRIWIGMEPDRKAMRLAMEEALGM